MERAGSERDVQQAINALKRGSQLLKYGSRGRPKFCHFRLSNDEATLIWFSGAEERQLSLRYITKIIPGQRTPNFQRFPRPDKEYQSFSLLYGSEGNSLDLVSKDKEEAETWFIGLKALISNPRTRSEGSFSSGASPARALVYSPYGSSSDHLQDGNEGLAYASPSKDGMFSPLPTPDAGSNTLVSDEARSRSGASMEPVRISMSSAVSSSSQGSGIDGSATDEADALGDVYVWGEGAGEGGSLGGGGHLRTAAALRLDALVPRALKSTLVLDVSSAACGRKHAALLTRQGEVFSWGDGAGGRLGHGIDADVPEPQLVEGLSGLVVESLACGDFHTCAVTLSGEVYTWGDGTQNAGLLGHGNDVSHWIPKIIGGALEAVRISSVACGAWHTALVSSSGQLFTFGDGTFGVLGHGDRKSQLVPREVESLRGLKTIAAACGVWHTAAVVEVIAGYSGTSSSGKLFTWGDGDKFRLGHGDKEHKLFPTCVAAVVDYNFRRVACGHSLTIGLSTTGRVFTMGSSIYGQLGEPAADGKNLVLVETNLSDAFVEEIGCGSHHVAVLTSRAEVYTWGKGANGRLGHGDNMDRNTPTLVEVLKDKQVKSVACGSSFTAVVCLHKAISGADQSVCSGCKQTFGFTRKRHNCYNCGCAFCHGCSSRKAFRACLAPNPSKAYRVCDPCFDKLQNSHMPTLMTKRKYEADNGVKFPATARATLGDRTGRTVSPRMPKRSSPPRSSTPIPTLAGLASPGNSVDKLKRKNALLQQEVQELKAQVNGLAMLCEQREHEKRHSAEKVREAVLLAGEETAKRRAAKEVIKSLTAELKDLAERLPTPQKQQRTVSLEKRRDAAVDADATNDRDGEAVVHQVSADRFNAEELEDEAPVVLTEAEEWVEQDQPGVYITLAAAAGGFRELRRVRFSRRRFNEKEAEQWWQDNRERVHKRYNIRASETAS